MPEDAMINKESLKPLDEGWGLSLYTHPLSGLIDVFKTEEYK